MLVYILAISMGHPADVFAWIILADDELPGLTIVGGIAGLTNLSEARLLDGAIMWL